MSDIFISYSSADRERAGVVAKALEARGWSVWWDREIPPGRAFDDVIEEALDAARCVVVLWSKASTASAWVRNEASDAMGRKVLIPALIDPDVKIPLEFRRLQAADLSRWRGDDSVEFRQFCDAVARNVAAPAGPRDIPPAAPAAVDPPLRVPPVAPPRAKARSAKALWIGGVLVVLVLAGIASMVPEQQGGQPMPVVQHVDPPLAGVAPTLGTGTTMPGAGLRVNLAWYDHALTYKGTLNWDGRSNTAQLSVEVFDTATRQSLGQRQVVAYGRPDAPGRNVFSTQIVVPGDSATAGTHTHNVNLVFEAQPNGNWVFVRNCAAPNDCYEVRH